MDVTRELGTSSSARRMEAESVANTKDAQSRPSVAPICAQRTVEAAGPASTPMAAKTGEMARLPSLQAAPVETATPSAAR